MNRSNLDPDLWVVIPAAGIGARMGADRPKQYLSLAGRTVLEHTLDCFAGHPRVRGMILAIALDDPYWPELALEVCVPVHVVPGGEERAQSVLNALDLLMALAKPQDWVLVHDAARPNLAREDLDRLIMTVEQDAVGGILAVPVRDTMKRADESARILHTEPREGLWHALTPQMFRLGLLHQALTRALAAGLKMTDEASAMEYAGFAPRLVEGRADNLKITRPEDLDLAEFFLSRKQV